MSLFCMDVLYWCLRRQTEMSTPSLPLLLQFIYQIARWYGCSNSYTSPIVAMSATNIFSYIWNTHVWITMKLGIHLVMIWFTYPYKHKLQVHVTSWLEVIHTVIVLNLFSMRGMVISSRTLRSFTWWIFSLPINVA